MSSGAAHPDRALTTIVVTGGSGFIGSAVVALAVEQGHRVVSLIRECEPAPEFEGVEHRVVDWSDAPGLCATLAALVPGAVIHCAGSTGRAGEDVAVLYRANVETVWDLLAAVRSACPDAGVVLLSSAAVYGPEPVVPTVEDAPLAPATHYAASKVMAEGLCRTFAGVDGIRCVAARPFNVLGPGEPGGSVTSRIVGQFEHGSAGSPVEVKLREAVSVRDLVDVEDVASALLVLASRGEAGAVYNVCRGRGVSIGDLVAAVADAQGSAYTLEVEDPQAVGTVSIGSPIALAALGWSPRYDLAESLHRVLTSRRP